MEHALKPNEKKNMRLAMLKQEETFRRQVYELHRLYRIQKMLMKNMEEHRVHIDEHRYCWNMNNEISLISQIDHHHHQDNVGRSSELSEFNTKSVLGVNEDHDRDDDHFISESEIELTLGPSRWSNKNQGKKTNDREEEIRLYSSPISSFSSSSTGSGSHKIVSRLFLQANEGIIDEERDQFKQLTPFAFANFEPLRT